MERCIGSFFHNRKRSSIIRACRGRRKKGKEDEDEDGRGCSRMEDLLLQAVNFFSLSLSQQRERSEERVGSFARCKFRLLQRGRISRQHFATDGAAGAYGDSLSLSDMSRRIDGRQSNDREE